MKQFDISQPKEELKKREQLLNFSWTMKLQIYDNLMIEEWKLIGFIAKLKIQIVIEHFCYWMKEVEVGYNNDEFNDRASQEVHSPSYSLSGVIILKSGQTLNNKVVKFCIFQNLPRVSKHRPC